VTRLVACLLLLVLGGCASTGPVPEDRFYRLDAVHPEQRLPSPVLRGGLNVTYVQADPLRGGRAVLYSDSAQPLQLRRYHYEFWVDQPPRMLRRALTSYLREAGIADSVVATDGAGDSAYSLRLNLLRFEQVLAGKSADVEVAVEATLSSGSGDSIVWTRVYERRRTSLSRQMHDTATAMQAALADVFADLRADLVSSIAQAR
jgi:ABC-type uncharacterized transport system auxiliary subunit